MARRCLNTLFILTQGAYLAKEGETVLVKVEGERKLKFPLLTLDGIVCFGNICLSPYLLASCAKHGVTVSHLSEHGRFLYRYVGPVSGNVLLRRAQYRMADDAAVSAKIARSVIIGKLTNCRTVLQRALRDHADRVETRGIRDAIRGIRGCLNKLKDTGNLDTLRGIEGEGSRLYFGVFEQLITVPGEDFRFNGRNRRPPLDPVNAMLSYGYMLLMHHVRSALESVGLDPAVGFLHRDRPGRYGLALDLMEELRPVFVDRLMVSLINRRQVSGTGFSRTGSGAIEMDETTRKTILSAWQKRKQEELFHPFLKERISIGLLTLIQARLMARFLRGDLDGYPPYVMK